MSIKKPKKKFSDKPSYYTAVGCAYEDLTKDNFKAKISNAFTNNDCPKLNEMTRYIEQLFDIENRKYYEHPYRIKLNEFLSENTKPCIINTHNSYIYANGDTYYSYTDNKDDTVICVWYLKTKEQVKAE